MQKPGHIEIKKKKYAPIASAAELVRQAIGDIDKMNADKKRLGHAQRFLNTRETLSRALRILDSS